MMGRKTIFACALLLSVSIFTAETAQAYILPLSFVVKLFGSERRKMTIRDLTIDLEVTTFDQHGSEEAHDGRLYIKKGGMMRLVLNAGSKEAAVLVQQNRTRKMSKKTPEFLLLPDYDPQAMLFAPSGEQLDEFANAILRTIKNVGIDYKAVALKMHKQHIVYVGGAKPWETQKSQIWFYKDSNLPAMVRYRTKGLDAQPHEFEIWWRGFGSPEAGNWFPSEVEFLRDGKKVMHWRLQKLSKNKDLPDTLFSTVKGS